MVSWCIWDFGPRDVLGSRVRLDLDFSLGGCGLINADESGKAEIDSTLELVADSEMLAAPSESEAQVQGNQMSEE